MGWNIKQITQSILLPCGHQSYNVSIIKILWSHWSRANIDNAVKHDDVIKWNICCAIGPWAGNSPVNGEFPSQRPVMRSFNFFFDLCLNKRLSKQSRRRWFETPSRSLWRHCNGVEGTCSSILKFQGHSFICCGYFVTSCSGEQNMISVQLSVLWQRLDWMVSQKKYWNIWIWMPPSPQPAHGLDISKASDKYIHGLSGKTM